MLHLSIETREEKKMLPFKFGSLFIISIFCLSIQRTSAQSRTDPKEVKAINTILGRWGKPASSAWNISGDPCTGAAIDVTDFDTTTINPIIKCDCGANANTNSACHITKLKVYGLNVVGTIPVELQDLPFLTNLDMRKNDLTGPLPAFIGNLTFMKYMSFETNSLSGTVPAELGNLSYLITLGLGANNFNGPLPSEFGNLNNLEELYLDNSGLSGELPLTLSKLTKMKIFQAWDVNFTGKIPDYLGSWPNLTYLYLNICGLSGELPLSLSKLTKMKTLDLSFNNITGTLPPSLFDLSSLENLLLGSNSLSGNLPILKSRSITKLDLSYNQLSGSLPSWVSDKNLELNLTGNNFTFDDSSSSTSTGVIVGVVVAISILGFLAALGFFIFKQKQRKRRPSEEDEEELAGMTNHRPDTFSYAELRNATNDFNISNLLGEGGFGAVHKGKLYDGRIIAVKQLTVANTQGKRQFMAEIGIISAVQHRNLVKLYGCCIEGDKRLVVYEYLENRSLDQALFGKSGIFLDWPTRFDILLGAARGLAYLHEESRIRIVHRDVKASNILLDADLNPKISDFGLAKLYDDKKTHITTRVAGTIGYLAPEYAMRGHLTEKADVFGFGVVALEVLSGRPNADATLEKEKVYLLGWAWRLHEGKHALDLVDPKLSSFDERQANRLLGVALLCTQASPMLRPHMSRVIAMLSGDTEVPEVTEKPSYLTEYDLEDSTSDFTSADFSTASGGFSKASESTSMHNSQIGEDMFSPSQPLANFGGR